MARVREWCACLMILRVIVPARGPGGLPRYPGTTPFSPNRLILGLHGVAGPLANPRDGWG